MHAGFIGSLMMISFLVIRTWIGCQNRARVRMVDNIPEDTCAGCEDCCCVGFRRSNPLCSRILRFLSRIDAYCSTSLPHFACAGILVWLLHRHPAAAPHGRGPRPVPSHLRQGYHARRGACISLMQLAQISDVKYEPRSSHDPRA